MSLVIGLGLVASFVGSPMVAARRTAEVSMLAPAVADLPSMYKARWHGDDTEHAPRPTAASNLRRTPSDEEEAVATMCVEKDGSDVCGEASFDSVDGGMVRAPLPASRGLSQPLAESRTLKQRAR